MLVVHLPRLVWSLLLLSYAAVFNNRPTLTANPAEHLKRAQRILRRGRLSELLYAAIELRFTLERMVQRDIIFGEAVSNRVLDEPSPVKKLANLRRLAPESALPHEVFFVNRDTGDRVSFGRYIPLDEERVVQIHGRLGALLHRQEGVPLGLPDSQWYADTEAFLQQTSAYLEEVHERDSGFFDYEGLEQFEVVVVDSPYAGT